METQFNSDEYLFAYPDGIENNFWNKARNKIILDTIKRNNINNILDIGSGRGIVTDYLFHSDLKISGVELGISTPISKSNVPIQYGTDALKTKDDEMHTIKALSLFDVIEHIEKPVDFLRDLITHFKKAEHIVITVPAKKELWSNFDDYFGHVKRYDLDTLHKELNELNFEIVESRYFFHSLYLIIRLNNFLNKKREIQFFAPLGINKLIHSILGSVFYLESKIVPRFITGSSIICVAKRR